MKLCYICREEERYDNPEDPPRPWTHPCSCTLIAHESCLLEWIKSAQQDASRAGNALKCPQCSATYELESDNPRILRILNAVNSVLSTAGKMATVVGFVSLTASFGFSIYAVSTSYGAFAVKEFLGEDMYNTLLTDNPSAWPWHAFIQLPIIPFSLILSRTRLFDNFPIVPLFLTWSSSPPVRSSIPSSSLWNFTRLGAPYSPPPLSWPPTPLMGMVLYPFVKIMYRRFFDKLTKFVMGAHTDAANRDGGPIRRVVWALNEDGPAPLRVRIGANIDPAPPGGAARPAGQGAPNAQVQEGGEGAAQRPLEGEENNGPDDPAAVAERTLHVTTSSLGRFVGGALLIPTISNRMGKLLYHLSQYSPFLRTFLAIRERPATLPAQIRLFGTPPGSSTSLIRQIGTHIVTGINVMFGGTPTWNEQDPVWWRNAVGLGIFVFAKDCIRLLHLYLTKRELQSRTVKNRTFAGVDIRELDLINPPPNTDTADSTATQPAPGSDVPS